MPLLSVDIRHLKVDGLRTGNPFDIAIVQFLHFGVGSRIRGNLLVNPEHLGHFLRRQYQVIGDVLVGYLVNDLLVSEEFGQGVQKIGVPIRSGR